MLTRVCSARSCLPCFPKYLVKSTVPHQVCVKTLQRGREHCKIRHSGIVCSSEKEPSDVTKAEDTNTGKTWILNSGMAALALALYAYAFFLSPNQTPTRDEYLIRSVIGIGDSSFTVTPVFVSVFNLMGIYPMIYASLLVPGARSENKVPAWPFVALSFAFGVFALMPYFVLWQPETNPPKMPPKKNELEGWNKLFMKGAETRILPSVLLVAASSLVIVAATSGSTAWLDYLKLFDESRFVHVTSIDFLTLTALIPFWMYNDAQRRDWGLRDTALPLLSLLPVIGPALYLCLRPKTDFSESAAPPS